MKLLHIDDETGQIEFELTKEEEALLQKMSEELGKPMEDIIRDAIENYIEKEDVDAWYFQTIEER